MEELMKHVGERLRHYRCLRDMSQAEFAKKANIQLKHYQDIECGKVMLQPGTAQRLSRLLGVHPSSIMSSWPTVKEFFCGYGDEAPGWIIEVFERLEQEAFDAEKYWMVHLMEHPMIGDIFQRMIASATRAKKLAQ